MSVAIRLGVSYLWIDSLCIIQDDNTDKEKNVYQMNKIYGNTALNIVRPSPVCMSTTANSKLLTGRNKSLHHGSDFFRGTRLDDTSGLDLGAVGPV